MYDNNKKMQQQRRSLVNVQVASKIILPAGLAQTPKARWFSRAFLYIFLFLSLYWILFKNNQKLLDVTSNYLITTTTNNYPNKSPLIFVTIEPYFACNGEIEKVICIETIILEDDVIPLQQMIGLEVETMICNKLRNPGEIKDIVEIPVCIQTAYTVNIMILYSEESPDKADTLKFVGNVEDEYLQEFIRTKLPATTRTIRMKYIDFPMYYSKMSNYYNQVEEKYRDNNYGNMIWRYASSRLLNPITTKIDPYTTWSMENITNDSVDALVIASANTLHITNEPLWQEGIEEMTTRVQHRNVPTIVLGIGVQVDFENMVEGGEFDLKSTNISFPFDFQKNLFTEISHRQTQPGIGARGDLTTSVCLNSGIENCISMGCPSLTISRNVNLGRTLQENWSRVIEKVRNGQEKLKIAIPLAQSQGHRETINTAYGFVARMIEQYGDSVTIITQTEGSEDRMNEFLDGYWKEMNPNSKLNSSEIQYDQYLNAESWLFYAGQYDLCISFRIHGAMPFIASGIPTIAVPIDFRILELLSAMKIPYLLPIEMRDMLSVYMNIVDPNNHGLVLSLLHKAHNQDFKEFEINRRAKITAWKSIVESAGLDIDPALTKIINSPLSFSG